MSPSTSLRDAAVLQNLAHQAPSAALPPTTPLSVLTKRPERDSAALARARRRVTSAAEADTHSAFVPRLMGFRPLEPRAGVGLAVMSFALMLVLRRGVAFRGAPAFASFSKGRNRSTAVAAAAGAGARAVAGRHTGPEGTKLPDVMHRTVSADELKVRVLNPRMRCTL